MVNITKEFQEMQEMEEKRMTKKEIIMDTYNFYKDNLDKFAINNYSGDCRYLTEDGKKCAVGRYMTEGKHQKEEGDFHMLSCIYSEKEFFIPKVRGHGQSFWQSLQEQLHDSPATHIRPLDRLNIGLKNMLKLYGEEESNQKEIYCMEN